eukprot:678878-Hanusia_phi.AAC.1
MNPRQTIKTQQPKERLQIPSFAIVSAIVQLVFVQTLNTVIAHIILISSNKHHLPTFSVSDSCCPRSCSATYQALRLCSTQ